MSAGPAQQRHCAAERRQRSNCASTGSRVIFLVENYDPVTKNADAIGVLTIWWHLTIQDYRNKPKDATQHETKLTIKSRSVFYSSWTTCTVTTTRRSANNSAARSDCASSFWRPSHHALAG